MCRRRLGLRRCVLNRSLKDLLPWRESYTGTEETLFFLQPSQYAPTQDLFPPLNVVAVLTGISPLVSSVTSPLPMKPPLPHLKPRSEGASRYVLRWLALTSTRTKREQ